MANAHDGESSAGRDAGGVASNAKEALKEEGQRLAEGVKAKAEGLAAEQKDLASSYLTDISAAIHDLISSLEKQGHGATARFTRSAADELQRIAQGLGEQDFNHFAREVAAFARRRPAIFFGGAFAVGFGLARFLTSSKPRDTDQEVSASARHRSTRFPSSDAARDAKEMPSTNRRERESVSVLPGDPTTKS